MQDQIQTLADRILYCKDCKQAFVFTVGEQRFYKEKALLNDPKRCKDCRDRMRRSRGEYQHNSDGGRGDRR